MKVWVLIIFSFSIDHATLLDREFYTHEACIAAARVVQASVQAVAPSPASATTNVQCVEDIKPIE